MNRSAPPGAEAATWRGLVIIGGAVLLGLAVTASFGNQATTIGASPSGTEPPRSIPAPSSTLPATTSTSSPLRDPKDVKVVVANATSTSGGGKKVIDALKPACYTVQLPVDATAKVKAEKRATTTVYSTPGYEREAAQITTRLGLQTTANAALPPDLPIPKTGVPAYNVLVLVGQDLVDTPPQPLPPCEGSTGSTGGSSTTRRGATTTKASGSKSTTTTRRAGTSTTKKTTTSTT